MGNNRNTGRLLPAMILVMVLTGCTVGPDFRRPDPPDVGGYLAGAVPAAMAQAPTALGGSQHLAAGAPLDACWWRELGSSKLDALIVEALDGNPTLGAAEATLQQAQELYVARSGSTLFPQAAASFAGQRQRFNQAASGQSGEAREFGLYNAGVDVRYTFDLAGGNRRALEALAARSDYQRYQLAGARLTVAASIVTAAISQARLAMQLETVESILRSQEKQLGLVRERVRLGQAAPDDILTLQTQMEQTRASMPLLRNQLQQTAHLLAVLVGRAPGARGLPSFTLADFTLPADLPLVVPSELVRARPDILGAEALLQAANAEYGVAISKLYPQLNLSTSLGSQTLTTGALFGSGSAVWNLVGQLTQPLFNPGLPAEKRAALAAFAAAAAHYQAVVLEALRNVADVLRALENDAARLGALAAAESAAQKSLASTARRYGLGAASYFEVLIAEQQAHQIRLDLIEAQAKRLSNSVAFYEAMGGGIGDEDKAAAAQ